MWNVGSIVVATLACWAGLAGPCRAAELSALEQRWLQGVAPVLAYARELKLPLDIIVQPQATPGLAPLGLALLGGRCKLVLSMRGNPEAQHVLDRIEPALLNATLELMAAHELGHCQRYLGGASIPNVGVAGGLDPEAEALAIAAQRREEGFADLVGLAWTLRHHPEQYAQLQSWLLAERAAELLPGSEHDTRAWVQEAHRPAALAAGPSMFDSAARLWAAVLLSERHAF